VTLCFAYFFSLVNKKKGEKSQTLKEEKEKFFDMRWYHIEATNLLSRGVIFVLSFALGQGLGFLRCGEEKS
jgi:hypothetical protein